MVADGWKELRSRALCVADFRVEGEIVPLGKSPFCDRRVGYITGGEFRGERLSGKILAGGGNWPLSGRSQNSQAVGTFDARAIWQTNDGALIYVTYTGRSVVSDAVSKTFRDPDAPAVDPSQYY